MSSATIMKTLPKMMIPLALSVGLAALNSLVPPVSAQPDPEDQPAKEAQDESPTPTSQPTEEKPAAKAAKGESSTELEPPREPSAADILKALTRPEDAPPKPLILPSQQGQTVRRKDVDPGSLPPNAIVPMAPRLYPDGFRIVDRPGRLTREGDYYVFAFESRGRGEPDMPIRLLPNRLLEDMEIVSAGGTRPVVFQISGELTEYHGANYLLVQKLLTRPELGNLK